MTSVGASQFLLMFSTQPNSALKRLELLDIEVDYEFEHLLSDIQSSTHTLEVIHGGHILQGDLYLSQSKKRRTRLGDPLMLLFEHVKNSNLRLWDLFAQLDKDKSLSISREEFRNGMKEANLPLDEFQIEQIMNTLDKDKNGEITFEELLEGHKRYREKERKKYETLLPFILSRPLSARHNEVRKSLNAPKPRAKGSTIVSMSGSMGDQNENHNAEQRLSLPNIATFQLPTINIITDEEDSPQPNVTQTSQPMKTHTYPLFANEVYTMDSSTTPAVQSERNSHFPESDYNPPSEQHTNNYMDEELKLPSIEHELIGRDDFNERPTMEFMEVSGNIELLGRPEASPSVTKLWRRREQSQRLLHSDTKALRRGSMPVSMETLQEKFHQNNL